MKPASADPRPADPFPARIEVLRGRRRTIEMSFEDGRFVLRVPHRTDTGRIGDVVAQMRQQLWRKLQRRSVYTDEALHGLSREVAKKHFAEAASASAPTSSATRAGWSRTCCTTS